MSGQGASDQAAAETFEEVARELKAGRGGKRVVAELVRQHWSKEAATEFVALVARSLEEQRHSRQGRAEMTQRAQIQMQTGVIWTVGGAIAACVLMLWVDSPLYIVAIAAIFYGLYDVSTGVSVWLKYREVPAPGTTPAKPGPGAPKKANVR